MSRFAFMVGCFAVLAGPVLAQSAITPAEVPPEEFEGREFTDSRGCIFLRSTFGGEVTWIPRFGPDRQPVCDGTPTTGVNAAAQTAPARVAPPAPAAEPEAPVAAAPAATPSRPASRPQAEVRPRPQAPAAAPRPAQADASGRHRDCPPSAPYGQLVRSAEGRMLVRCVTSPSLFLN